MDATKDEEQGVVDVLSVLFFIQMSNPINFYRCVQQGAHCRMVQSKRMQIHCTKVKEKQQPTLHTQSINPPSAPHNMHAFFFHCTTSKAHDTCIATSPIKMQKSWWHPCRLHCKGSNESVGHGNASEKITLEFLSMSMMTERVAPRAARSCCPTDRRMGGVTPSPCLCGGQQGSWQLWVRPSLSSLTLTRIRVWSSRLALPSATLSLEPYSVAYHGCHSTLLHLYGLVGYACVMCFGGSAMKEECMHVVWGRMGD